MRIIPSLLHLYTICLMTAIYLFSSSHLCYPNKNQEDGSPDRAKPAPVRYRKSSTYTNTHTHAYVPQHPDFFDVYWTTDSIGVAFGRAKGENNKIQNEHRLTNKLA